MMAGANGDSVLIENRSDVVWMNAFERERDDARFVRGRSDDAQTVDFLQTTRRVREEFLFVRADVLDADRGDVIERGGEADHPFDVRRSRFEFVRQRVVRRLLE